MGIYEYRATCHVEGSFAFNTFCVITRGAYHDVAARYFQDAVGGRCTSVLFLIANLHALG